MESHPTPDPLEPPASVPQPTPAQLEAQLAEERRAAAEQTEADEPGDGGDLGGELDDAGGDRGAGAAEAFTAEQLEQIAQLEELEKARESYERKVRKIMGPEIPLVACEHCNGVGFDMSGGADEDALLEHENFRRCTACDGYGGVRTGSRVMGSEVASCPVCKGRGFLELVEGTGGDHADEQNGHREPVYGAPSWLGDPNLAPAGAQ